MRRESAKLCLQYKIRARKVALPPHTASMRAQRLVRHTPPSYPGRSARALQRVRDTSASTTAPHLLAVHHLRRHCLPRARGELPPPGHDHHGGRGYEQHPGADEPAEIAECEEEGALAAVEMAAGGFEQARGADHMSFGLRRVTLRGCRHAAEQDRDIVEQAVRPGEFEEGIDADQDEADAFQLPHRRRGT